MNPGKIKKMDTRFGQNMVCFFQIFKQEAAIMTKGVNQKLKLLLLYQYFTQETDADHGVTLADITAFLAKQEIHVDRKTLYQDFEELRAFGLDIAASKEGIRYTYRLINPQFELPELKMLIDSVQSAKFISDTKSKELIAKLERLASKPMARNLRRQVLITGRTKTINRSVYYTIDRLHQAINSGVQVSFHYMKWNIHKTLVARNHGRRFLVSPWAMVLNDDNYYLVAYEPIDDCIKHYRVDKIKDLVQLEEPREGQEEFEKLDLARYANMHFGMFNGETVKVDLRAKNGLVGVLIDRFGQDVMIIPDGPDHVTTTVEVAVSPQFLGWITALKDGVVITGPEKVRDEMRELGRLLLHLYRD